MTPLAQSGLSSRSAMMPIDEIVRDEIAAVHDRLGLLAELGSRGDGRAQHVAGRKLDQPPLILENLGLCAFAGARRAEQDQVHGVAAARNLNVAGALP